MIYQRYDIGADEFIDLTDEEIVAFQQKDISLGGSMGLRHQLRIDRSRPGPDIFQDVACNEAVDRQKRDLDAWFVAWSRTQISAELQQ